MVSAEPEGKNTQACLGEDPRALLRKRGDDGPQPHGSPRAWVAFDDASAASFGRNEARRSCTQQRPDDKG